MSLSKSLYQNAGTPASQETETVQEPASRLLKLPRSPAYIIEEILPSRSVHIVTGPSHAGKTPWLLALLDDIVKGNPVLGRKVHPVPIHYINFENTREQVLSRISDIATIDLDPKSIECIPLRVIDDMHSEDKAIEYALSRCPRGGLLALEPLDALMTGDPSKRKSVALYMGKLLDYAVARDITLKGSMPFAKTKMGTGYMRCREKIYGAVSWATSAQTVFTIDGGVFTVSPRNGNEERYALKFDPLGRPELSEKKVAGWGQALASLSEFLEAVDWGATFKGKEALEATGVSQDTLDRFVRANGIVTRVSKGTFRKGEIK